MCTLNPFVSPRVRECVRLFFFLPPLSRPWSRWVRREITGHLVINDMRHVRSLSHMFPNLRVIRGEKLVHAFALVITSNLALTDVSETTDGVVRSARSDATATATAVEFN